MSKVITEILSPTFKQTYYVSKSGYPSNVVPLLYEHPNELDRYTTILISVLYSDYAMAEYVRSAYTDDIRVLATPSEAVKYGGSAKLFIDKSMPGDGEKLNDSSSDAYTFLWNINRPNFNVNKEQQLRDRALIARQLSKAFHNCHSYTDGGKFFDTYIAPIILDTSGRYTSSPGGWPICYAYMYYSRIIFMLLNELTHDSKYDYKKSDTSFDYDAKWENNKKGSDYYRHEFSGTIAHKRVCLEPNKMSDAFSLSHMLQNMVLISSSIVSDNEVIFYNQPTNESITSKLSTMPADSAYNALWAYDAQRNQDIYNYGFKSGAWKYYSEDAAYIFNDTQAHMCWKALSMHKDIIGGKILSTMKKFTQLLPRGLLELNLKFNKNITQYAPVTFPWSVIDNNYCYTQNYTISKRGKYRSIVVSDDESWLDQIYTSMSNKADKAQIKLPGNYMEFDNIKKAQANIIKDLNTSSSVDVNGNSYNISFSYTNVVNDVDLTGGCGGSYIIPRPCITIDTSNSMIYIITFDCTQRGYVGIKDVGNSTTRRCHMDGTCMTYEITYNSIGGVPQYFATYKSYDI